jgi:hypothetical protein
MNQNLNTTKPENLTLNQVTLVRLAKYQDRVERRQHTAGFRTGVVVGLAGGVERPVSNTISRSERDRLEKLLGGALSFKRGEGGSRGDPLGFQLLLGFETGTLYGNDASDLRAMFPRIVRVKKGLFGTTFLDPSSANSRNSGGG